ncbi:MAG: disulfide bond formation protein B [Acidimicrobiia bacterium]
MSTADLSKLFAVLSLFVWAATLLTIVLAVIHRRSPDSTAGYLFDDLRRNAVWLALAVAAFTTFGSLYLSEIAHFLPCPLCWYQRICMYPLAVALLVGGLRRDREVWAYVLPPALIGAAFAIYHTQLQAFPAQHGPFCKIAEPCTVRYIWEFGFVSIPFMSLAAFSFIIAMMLLVRSDRPDEPESEPTDVSDPEDTLTLSARGVL